MSRSSAPLPISGIWLQSVLLRRILALAALLAGELMVQMLCKLVGSAASSDTRYDLIGDQFEVGALRSAVFFALTLTSLVIVYSRAALRRVASYVRQLRVSGPLLIVHLASFLLFIAIPLLFSAVEIPISSGYVVLGRWGLLLMTAIFGVLAFVPLRIWLVVNRAAGIKVWLYALFVGLVVNPLAHLAWGVWLPAADLTFRTVAILLRPVLPGLTVNPGNREIGTAAFRVLIQPECSGLEGMSLLVVFGALWLFLFRKDYRFPQALLLVPAGVLVLWSLNSVRIAALIIIGSSGAPGVALNGFHSQAGWIAFIAVTLGIWLTLRRLPWMNKYESSLDTAAVPIENPTAAYLLPLLAILGSAMIARATSDSFEYLYPLRLIAAGAVLWSYRKRYDRSVWSWNWTGVAVGVAVFALWLGLDRLLGIPQDSSLPADLGTLAPAARVFWLTCRVAAAVLTVPLAEELAFRGFLARRLASRHFDTVEYARLTIPGILISSVVFGTLHGNRWMAGCVAGVIYAVLAKRTNCLGNAIVAHAVTNALIAVSVLGFDMWGLW